MPTMETLEERSPAEPLPRIVSTIAPSAVLIMRAVNATLAVVSRCPTPIPKNPPPDLSVDILNSVTEPIIT